MHPLCSLGRPSAAVGAFNAATDLVTATSRFAMDPAWTVVYASVWPLFADRIDASAIADVPSDALGCTETLGAVGASIW